MYDLDNPEHRYEGEWSDNKQSGQGSYCWGDGSSYVGQFDDGLFDGYGVMKYGKDKKTDRYEGEWKEGKQSGYGSEFYRNGANYVGQVCILPFQTLFVYFIY